MIDPFKQPKTKQEPQIRLAEVMSITGGLFLRFEGEPNTRTKSTKHVASYTPAVGDRVQVALISGTHVVTGEVV